MEASLRKIGKIRRKRNNLQKGEKTKKMFVVTFASSFILNKITCETIGIFSEVTNSCGIKDSESGDEV